jgi:hypothetical protein
MKTKDLTRTSITISTLLSLSIRPITPIGLMETGANQIWVDLTALMMIQLEIQEVILALIGMIRTHKDVGSMMTKILQLVCSAAFARKLLRGVIRQTATIMMMFQMPLETLVQGGMMRTLKDAVDGILTHSKLLMPAVLVEEEIQ